MTLPVYRLRRILAVTAALLIVLVAGMYFYARSRVRNVLKEVHGKIGYDIKQTANGFQFSKSDGKRTLFSVQASDVKEFKLNGHAELHKVSIVLYGRDSSRYDQIYGDDFAYDQKSGNVTANGDVRIDLVANPAGLSSPDQSAPKVLKNPIHLKTRDLVFSKNTGDAWTDARVEFSTPQASGWAVGVRYSGQSNTLTLASQIHIVLTGAHEGTLDADHGIITNDSRGNDSRETDANGGDSRQIVLDHPRFRRAGGTLQADQSVFYLGTDNNVERVLATGNVVADTQTGERLGGKGSSAAKEPSEIHTRADQAEFLMTDKRNLLRTATLSGNVHVEQEGPQAAEGDAGRMILDFAGKNQLQAVHAIDGARLTQRAESSSGSSSVQRNSAGRDSAGRGSARQNFELTAPVIDFKVRQGHILERAVTSGAAQITITPAEAASSKAGPSPAHTSPESTVVTAGKFDAQFTIADGRDHLSLIHGAPAARIVNSAAGQPDRISTSDSVDAVFLPQGGIESVTQQGNVVYTDSQSPDKRMQAWADSARYTPADQMLLLTGSPRVASGSMTTTASTIRINRATGDALAEGDVKSTYSEVKEQPDGALLASSSPIHVTAHSMTAHNSPGVALYSGNVRLWQDANIIEAPTIQFDRDRRFVVAQGTAAQPVQTILVQEEKGNAADAKSGMSSPIAITASRITYTDSERKVHYEGGVVAKGADFTATAKTADAYLLARRQTGASSDGQAADNQPFAGPGRLDRMVAQGDVVIQQPNRRAEGQTLVYTAADDKFVLTGGPPSIFDAERGKITGVSLTFFRRDDRVLVEGEASTPVVTQTRVAK